MYSINYINNIFSTNEGISYNKDNYVSTNTTDNYLENQSTISEPMPFSPSSTDTEARNQVVISEASSQEKLDGLRSICEIPKKYQQIFSSYPSFNAIQSKVLDDVLYSDVSVVVSAPTGSGKTAIFEMAIIRLLLKLDELRYTGDYKIVYMAPVKALCSERLADWCGKFSCLGVRCKEFTGDTDDYEISSLLSYNMFLTTPEKWDSITRKWQDNKKLVQMVKLFLIDEVHLLSEEQRGPILEAVVSRMKTIQNVIDVTQRQNQDQQMNDTNMECEELSFGIRFLALSATIPNIEDIACWLGTSPESPAKYFKIDEDLRPVKLQKVVLGYPCPANISQFRFEINLSFKLRPLLFKYSDGKPTLIFCSTRKGVEHTCSIVTQQITFNLNPEQKQILSEIATSLTDNKLKEYVKAGVGYHHAGMEKENRQIIQNIFRDGILPILVTTSTLAMGVNLPAHLVIIKATQQYAGGAYVDYTETQILQMIGRAGRPQFDTSAVAIIMTKDSQRSRYDKLLSGKDLIESSLHKHLPEHLNSEVVLHTITDLGYAMEWIRSTFLYVRALQNPNHYGIPGKLNKKGIEKKLEEMCQRELNALASAKLLTMDVLDVHPTADGILMARFYLQLGTMKAFSKVTGKESLEEMLKIVSAFQEFSGMQLRVSEKKNLNMLNAAPNNACIRFPIRGKIMTKDMKINCLIQASLGCLPIHDPALRQDAVRIMWIGKRIIAALAQYLLQHPYYRALLSTITLAKCFHCKLWDDSPYVSKQLKGIGAALSTMLVASNKTNFQSIIEANPRDLESILNRPPPMGDHLKDAVLHLPRFELRVETSTDTSIVQVKIFVEMVNRNVVQEHNTAGNNHWLVLIVGDSNNKRLCRDRFIDTHLLDDVKCWTVEVNEASSVTEIYVNLISEQWVGLDIHSSIKLPQQRQTPQRVKNALEKFIKQKGLKTQALSSNSSKTPHCKQVKQSIVDQIRDLSEKRLGNTPCITRSKLTLKKYAYQPSRIAKFLPSSKQCEQKKNNHTNDIQQTESMLEVCEQIKILPTENVNHSRQSNFDCQQNHLLSQDSNSEIECSETPKLRLNTESKNSTYRDNQINCPNTDEHQLQEPNKDISFYIQLLYKDKIISQQKQMKKRIQQHFAVNLNNSSSPQNLQDVSLIGVLSKNDAKQEISKPACQYEFSYIHDNETSDPSFIQKSSLNSHSKPSEPNMFGRNISTSDNKNETKSLPKEFANERKQTNNQDECNELNNSMQNSVSTGINDNRVAVSTSPTFITEASSSSAIQAKKEDTVIEKVSTFKKTLPKYCYPIFVKSLQSDSYSNSDIVIKSEGHNVNEPILPHTEVIPKQELKETDINNDLQSGGFTNLNIKPMLDTHKDMLQFDNTHEIEKQLSSAKSNLSRYPLNETDPFNNVNEIQYYTSEVINDGTIYQNNSTLQSNNDSRPKCIINLDTKLTSLSLETQQEVQQLDVINEISPTKQNTSQPKLAEGPFNTKNEIKNQCSEVMKNNEAEQHFEESKNQATIQISNVSLNTNNMKANCFPNMSEKMALLHLPEETQFDVIHKFKKKIPVAKPFFSQSYPQEGSFGNENETENNTIEIIDSYITEEQCEEFDNGIESKNDVTSQSNKDTQLKYSENLDLKIIPNQHEKENQMNVIHEMEKEAANANEESDFLQPIEGHSINITKNKDNFREPINGPMSQVNNTLSDDIEIVCSDKLLKTTKATRSNHKDAMQININVNVNAPSHLPPCRNKTQSFTNNSYQKHEVEFTNLQSKNKNTETDYRELTQKDSTLHRIYPVPVPNFTLVENIDQFLGDLAQDAYEETYKECDTNFNNTMTDNTNYTFNTITGHNKEVTFFPYDRNFPRDRKEAHKFKILDKKCSPFLNLLQNKVITKETCHSYTEKEKDNCNILKISQQLAPQLQFQPNSQLKSTTSEGNQRTALSQFTPMKKQFDTTRQTLSFSQHHDSMYNIPSQEMKVQQTGQHFKRKLDQEEDLYSVPNSQPSSKQRTTFSQQPWKKLRHMEPIVSNTSSGPGQSKYPYALKSCSNSQNTFKYKFPVSSEFSMNKFTHSIEDVCTPPIINENKYTKPSSSLSKELMHKLSIQPNSNKTPNTNSDQTSPSSPSPHKFQPSYNLYQYLVNNNGKYVQDYNRLPSTQNRFTELQDKKNIPNENSRKENNFTRCYYSLGQQMPTPNQKSLGRHFNEFEKTSYSDSWELPSQHSSQKRMVLHKPINFPNENCGSYDSFKSQWKKFDVPPIENEVLDSYYPNFINNSQDLFDEDCSSYKHTDIYNKCSSPDLNLGSADRACSINNRELTQSELISELTGKESEIQSSHDLRIYETTGTRSKRTYYPSPIGSQELIYSGRISGSINKDSENPTNQYPINNERIRALGKKVPDKYESSYLSRIPNLTQLPEHRQKLHGKPYCVPSYFPKENYMFTQFDRNTDRMRRSSNSNSNCILNNSEMDIQSEISETPPQHSYSLHSPNAAVAREKYHSQIMETQFHPNMTDLYLPVNTALPSISNNFYPMDRTYNNLQSTKILTNTCPVREKTYSYLQTSRKQCPTKGRGIYDY